MNPLFEQMAQSQNPMQNIIQQAREFRKNFTGNPRDEVQRLLNTGAMSQKTFNQLSQIAQQVVQAMGENI